jgi:hypothetical protein
LLIIYFDVVIGTTMVAWTLRETAAATQARPALPPEDVKKWMLDFEAAFEMWVSRKLPIPLDLKDPDGCRFSSLRYIWLLEKRC